MEKIIVTKYEYLVLFLFLSGIPVNHFFLKLNCCSIMGLYVFGMFFEFATAYAWKYNPALQNSTFTIRHGDVNWIMGLGWLGALTFGFSAGKFVFLTFPNFNALISDVLGMGIVGNMLEQIYLAVGLWRYNPNSFIVNLGLKKPVYVFKIPLAVRIGYFVMGALVHVLIYSWWQLNECR